MRVSGIAEDVGEVLDADSRALAGAVKQSS